MTTIIECPACSTRYKMNKPIPEGGRSVKCARCGHQWRLLPEEPEELVEMDEIEHDPAAAAFHPDQPAPAGFAGSTAEEGHDAPADDGEGPGDMSWEVRRGNLAAALASMSEAGQSGGAAYAAEGEQAFHQAGEWASEGADSAVTEEHHAGPAMSGLESQEEFAHSDPVAYATGLGTWRTEPAWMSGAAAAEATAEADPENSIREALRAAIEDRETNEEGEFGGEGTPATARLGLDDARFAEALAATDAVISKGDAGDASSVPGSSRWDDFSATDRFVQADAGETATAATGRDDTQAFENDIAGIFRQQMQGKRNFRPASPRRAEGGFTDYDMESGRASEIADDRYMADSPLDADAAALQAALEGSLRVRHAEESRSGGGGLALAAAWAVFLSVLTGVTLAFVSFRDEIVTALPGMAGLYRGIGLGVQAQQIDFGPVHYRWTVADGKPMIEVTGQIINLTDRDIPVPRVLVNVHDKANTDTVKATATIRSEPLAARETADFTLEFLSPPKTIGQIELAFAEKE